MNTAITGIQRAISTASGNWSVSALGGVTFASTPNFNGTVSEEAVVTINVVSNDSDIDGTIDESTVDLDPLVLGIQNTMSTVPGSWSVSTSGVVTFTPASDFNDSFGTYTVTTTVGRRPTLLQ